MEANLISDRTHLLDDFSKQTKTHPFFGPHHLRAETALKVTDIADLDIDLGKAPHALELNILSAPAL
jgi:hypothetical protein